MLFSLITDDALHWHVKVRNLDSMQEERDVQPLGKSWTAVSLLPCGPDQSQPAEGLEWPDDADSWLLLAYRDMVLARAFDSEAIALQRQGELAMWPSALGQEAAQVGVAHALRRQDMVFPTYREHALALSRGINPLAVMSLFRGTTHGGWDPIANNIASYSLVIGAQALHAVGFAMAIVRDGDVGTGNPATDRAVLAFIGDGALSEGETNEAFVWAAAQSLPVVFYCQNNQWAISTPYSTQSCVPAAQRADGFGFRGIRVDGNDVLACREISRAALDDARSGGGPCLIEAVTYRRNAHTTADDDLRYRTEAENTRWQQLDPIDRLAKYLDVSQDGWREEVLPDLASESRSLSERLRSGCRGLSEPSPEGPFINTYTRMTPELDRQRLQHLEFINSWVAT